MGRGGRGLGPERGRYWSACWRDWKGKQMGGRLVSLGAGREIVENCVCGGKKSWGGEAMRATLLMVLDA